MFSGRNALVRAGCLALLSCVCSLPPLFAQGISGSITGTVVDPSSLVVPGATVAVFPQAVRGISSKGDLSTTMNFSLGVQHRIFSMFVLDVSYVGSLSRHMPEARDRGCKMGSAVP